MVFQLKVRGVSKEDEKKLCRKYSKLLKKGKVDRIEVVCKLFLELVCLYFNNPKRKLYKLFFPVIMANFIENGSINSVIEEYRKKKRLYSESYTCRILRQLDKNTGTEISEIFRKILFKILKRNGFKNRGFCVAIDITAKPFYGNKNLLMVKGTKRKAGTNNAIQYLTASIVEEGVRFNLICYPISSVTLVNRIFEKLINEIRKITPAKIFYLDRWFGNKKYCKIIKFLKHKFVMPITKNNKLKGLELSIKKQTKTRKSEYWISSIDYIFSEDMPKEYQVEVKLIILHEDKKVFFFITNIDNLSLLEYYLASESYFSRFGIETNYRVDNIFCPLTSSVTASIRYLLMQVSLIIQDLWTLVNFLMHKKEMKQPREKYKRDYSLPSIIKARIKKLKFIWRPVITVVQFKRRMEEVLG